MPAKLDTVYVVQRSNGTQEILLARSEAVRYVLSHLGILWGAAGAIFGLLPRSLQNWAYDFVARNRYQTFGRTDTCPLPSATDRAKFLDVA